jgi:Uma2 family endonuclease
MSVATQSRMSLEAYLTYNDGTDARYELVDGKLVQMPQGTGKHGDISEFLNDEFKAEIKRNDLPWVSKDMKMSIQSPRGSRWETARVPDVVVLLSAQWELMADREAFIPLNEPPLRLVVEVVSPATVTVDYRTKHSEYAVLDIPEYWIVDPIESRVTVCTLQYGAYMDQAFTGDQIIESPTFPGLTLTTTQVLTTSKSLDATLN